MKKSKLQLRELQVKSFVTNIKSEVEQTVKGGVITVQTPEAESIVQGCPTNLFICPINTRLFTCGVC
ncbi:MAG: pinensin family lanthipeptide [Bacteroidota bacterium]